MAYDALVRICERKRGCRKREAAARRTLAACPGLQFGVAQSLVFGVLVLSCKDPAAAVPAEAEAKPVVTVSSASPTQTPTPTHTAVEVAPVVFGDGGIAGCATVVSATRLKRPGPYALAPVGGSIAAYVREDDKPSLLATVDRGVKDESEGGSKPSSPPCVAAGARAFCADAQGLVRLYELGPAPRKVESVTLHARPGAALAAAPVGSHSVVAYLRDHVTSEGVRMAAYLADETGAEQPLSDDGAGATSVALTGAVAVYIDARRGMSPVHARALGAGPKVAVGPDVVVFVGGSAEAATRVYAASSGKTTWALLPIAHDIGFGLAVIALGADPQMDAPVAWSDYPNGLDPAPVAAATTDDGTAYVARVRPSSPTYNSPRVLELGRIDAAGAFVAMGLVPTQGSPRDVALAAAGKDVVLAWDDGAGGAIERLHCVP